MKKTIGQRLDQLNIIDKRHLDYKFYNRILKESLVLIKTYIKEKETD